MSKNYTNDPLDTSLPVRGESKLEFETLPAKIEEVNRIPAEVIQDKESVSLAEYDQVEEYLLKIGKKPARIAKLVGITLKRANKLIADVENIRWGIGNTSKSQERINYKKLYQNRLDELIERGFKYIDNGYKGRELSPSEFKLISGEIRAASGDKAKMHGIGNTVIFEQFNQQTNINMSPAQHSIEKDKDMRFLLNELTEVLTNADEEDILDIEVVE